MDAQAGLRLCCSQTPKGTFSRVKAQMIVEFCVLFIAIDKAKEKNLPQVTYNFKIGTLGWTISVLCYKFLHGENMKTFAKVSA